MQWNNQAERRQWRAAHVEQFLKNHGLHQDALSPSTLKCLDDWARQVQLVRAQPSANWSKPILDLCRAVESQLEAALGSIAGLDILSAGDNLGTKAHKLERVAFDTVLKQRLSARGLKPGAVKALPKKLLALAALRSNTGSAHGANTMINATESHAQTAQRAAASILRDLVSSGTTGN